jgi:signal transduction histidine kinase
MRKMVTHLVAVALLSCTLVSQAVAAADPPDSARVSRYLATANTYLKRNQIDSVWWAATQARALAEKSNQRLLMAWADQLIGLCHFYEGRYEKGIALQTAVWRKADSLGDDLLRAHAQKMIGWMYTEMGKERDAMQLFRASLPAFRAHAHRDFQKSIGIAYFGIATAYFYLNHFDSALMYYDSAVAAKPAMDPREMALTLADRAAVKRDHLQNLPGALRDASEALDLMTPLPGHLDALAYVQAEWALTLARKGDYAQADRWAESAYAIYGSLPFLKRYVSVYQNMAHTFAETGNYRMAYRAEQETRTLQDSIHALRKMQIVEDLRLRYETEQQSKAIEQLSEQADLQQLEIGRSKTALWVLAINLLALLTGSIWFYRKREKYHTRIRELEAAHQIKVEKEKIAKDLHDSLGSQLSTISIGLQRAATENKNEGLLSLQTMADKVMQELRDFIWAMNKEAVTMEELEQRINTLFWQYRKLDYPVSFDLYVEGHLQTAQLPPGTGIQLFRITQEAVQNAIRHSRCTAIHVGLTNGNGHLKLTVKDNGSGFHWPPTVPGDHFGLANMQKRAATIRGHFHIDTGLQRGTTVSVAVPMLARA